MARATIQVRGLQHTLRALQVIDPEAMKALRRGFRQAAEPIIEKTKRRVPARPMTNWGDWGERLDWDSNQVKRGLKTQITVAKKYAAFRLVSNSAAGAVYENAGSKSPYSKFTLGLVRSGQGPEPRLLVKTWKEEKGIKTIYTQVGRLIEDATNRVAEAVR